MLGLNAVGILRPLVGEKVEANGTKDLSRALVTCVNGGFDASPVLGVKTVRIVGRANKAFSGRFQPLLWEAMVAVFAV